MTAPQYTEFSSRVESFNKWKGNEISIEDYASFGFYYANLHDNISKEPIIACHECDLTLGSIDKEDEPKKLHSIYAPHCKYAARSAHNMQINARKTFEYEANIFNKIIKMFLRIGSLFGLNKVYLTECFPGLSTRSFTRENTNILLANSKVVYPQYMYYLDRLKSFEDWPQILEPLKIQLAALGYFYSGIGDLVYCHSCGTGMKKWNLDDDPLELHQCELSIDGQGEEYLYLKKLRNSVLPFQRWNTREIAGPAEIGSQIDTNERNIRDKRLCRECKIHESNVVYLPCSHLIHCTKCARRDRCDECRQRIGHILWIYT